VIVVGYDRGAASAGEIAVGLRGLGPVALLVADSPHTRQLAGVLAAVGRVVPLTGHHPTDLARVRALAPQAVLTFSEPLLPVVGRLAASLGLPGHTAAATALLTDKTLQRNRLRDAGVDDVRSWPVSSLADWPAARAHVGLPAVVKPSHGQGSRHTTIVDDDRTAPGIVHATLAAVHPSAIVVEELLVGRRSMPFGDYVSVESARGPRGTDHLAITGKLPLVAPFREAGRLWPAPLAAAERARVTDLVDRALRALDVGVGLTHTEVKLTPAGPRVIEVNGRLGGHINGLARQVAGVDLVRLAGLLALGRDPEPPVGLDWPSRVHFQHNSLAPVRPSELLAVHGAAVVRTVARVDGFRSYARPGDIFDADVMTRHLDLLWGRCDDHADVPAVLEEALRPLHYEFRFAEGVRSIPAAELMSW
jgi:carbamoylphosphate synthase large subunit